MTPPSLDDNFFRHEYGRLVSRLSCRVGVQHLEAVEDAVQVALLKALEAWEYAGLPENPVAWLYRVAWNCLLGELRKQNRRSRILREHVAFELPSTSDENCTSDQIQDELLRMLFVCCDETIPIDSQVVLALKTLCGFDVGEIAIRLFTTSANVYKRLDRARERLRESTADAFDLNCELVVRRLPAVQQVLYLLFTEGYFSSNSNCVIRRELCDEAIRLAKVLASHPLGQHASTYALLALMHLHIARFAGRTSLSGGLLLLEEQNREEWNQQEIGEGLRYLAMSAEGDEFSRFHAEAGIAAEHCLAPTFKDTRWDRIVEMYELLETTAVSPVHALNRAVAVAEWKSPIDGLSILDSLTPPTWLSGSYMWAAVYSDLHYRCGNIESACRYRSIAIVTAPSDAIRGLIKRRLQFPY